MDKYFTIKGTISGGTYWLRGFLQGALIYVFGLGLILGVITATKRINAFRGEDKRWQNLAVAIGIYVALFIGSVGLAVGNELMIDGGSGPWFIGGFVFILPHLYLMFANSNIKNHNG